MQPRNLFLRLIVVTRMLSSIYVELGFVGQIVVEWPPDYEVTQYVFWAGVD